MKRPFPPALLAPVLFLFNRHHSGLGETRRKGLDVQVSARIGERAGLSLAGREVFSTQRHISNASLDGVAGVAADRRAHHRPVPGGAGFCPAQDAAARHRLAEAPPGRRVTMQGVKHRLFLFDLDDTLLDFKASERLSFARTLRELGLDGELEALFQQYQAINLALWRAFEAGTVSKELLKVERFRRTFAANGLALDPDRASGVYLDSLSETVVLVDGAARLCESLAALGEVGIITNGVHHIQHKRIASSGLGGHIAFVATSEACGHAKPDSRFFDYTSKMARRFAKHDTVIVGDRLDADILGANRFGIDSCWFNPARLANDSEALPSCEVASLEDVIPALGRLAA